MKSQAPQATCPNDEQIAAFVDGELVGAERRRVEEHLGSCPDCAEWVAEVLALETEDGKASDEAPAPPSLLDRGGTAFLAAAAALLLALPVIFSLRGHRDALDSDAMLSFIPRGDRLGRALEEGWYEHAWSGTRGDGGPRATSPAAFQLGVRAVDLAAALRAERTGDLTILVARTRRVLESVEDSFVLDLALLGLEEQVASDPPDLDAARASALHFEESLAEVEPQDAVLLGKWAGAGNAALAAEAEIFFKSRHWAAGLDLLTAERLDPRLRDLGEALRTTRSGRPDGPPEPAR